MAPAPRRASADRIIVRGAREHNLKNVDLDLPRDALIVFTGLSGSGKSSLAFDTIYAEGQRRYVESLSAYARQFLGQMDKPDVDFIEGLSPAISIDQKSTSRNPRSTVGTITEIWDYLRLLYARIGIVHDPVTGEVITSQTPDEMVDEVVRLPEGTRFQVLAPVVRGRKGEFKDLFSDLAAQGFSRVRVDGEVIDLTDPPALRKTYKHDIQVIVDRLVLKDGIRRRLASAVEQCVDLADGFAWIEVVKRPDVELDEPELIEFNANRAKLAPRDFSFNSPYGACPVCNGLGYQLNVDPELVIGDVDLSVEEGCVEPWATGGQAGYWRQLLIAVVTHVGEDPATPWKKLPKKAKDAVLYGLDEKVEVVYQNRYGRRRRYNANVEGVVATLRRRHSDTDSDYVREQVEQYMREIPCPTCDGKRLKPGPLAVTLGRYNIAEVSALPIGDAQQFLATLELTERQNLIGARVLKEIQARLDFLVDVGLDYLTLERPAGSLSGGEAQRIRLATQIGAGLVGVLYVLDEPSIGLHQRDNERLIETLIRLRDMGNTLIVVEHDEATVEAADHVVDIGPLAGEHGGQIVHSGSVAGLKKNKDSITGDYLAGRRGIPVPMIRRTGNGDKIVIRKAVEHNLQNLTVTFPLGTFTAVTGVSGSGKSTVVNAILSRALMRHVYGSKMRPGRHQKITGLDAVDKVVVVDQSPIGRTPRSNPATYTGMFDHIRKLFSSTQEAKVRGYQPGRFSFNVKGGRCEACKGDGTLKIEMHFLPDVYVPCEVCAGKRYNRETLEVRYKTKTISDVLEMPIAEAHVFFQNIPRIAGHLETLVDVGLGYVRLGQPATTLSGGEAQRVKLASELKKRATGQTVYILDEPTTGLHFEDVRRLLEVLHRLVEKGNTVIVIEHNLDVIKTADHIIDLGPEGGSGGGTIVATGTPEEVAGAAGSYTGKFLSGLV